MGITGFPTIIRLCSALLAGVWLLAAQAAARAGDTEASSVPFPDEAATVHITIGAADLVGKPVYAWRSDISGTGQAVLFSSRPQPKPRPVVTTTSRALRQTAVALPGTPPAGMPVAARALTSGFGYRAHPTLGGWRAHTGVDLAAPAGSPIVATSDGVVSTANWSGGYGLLVTVEHGGGMQTRYAHLSRLAVVPGQYVRRGEVIGYVGSTGRSTGPHLHYEIRVNGQAVNPLGRGGRR